MRTYTQTLEQAEALRQQLGEGWTIDMHRHGPWQFRLFSPSGHLMVAQRDDQTYTTRLLMTPRDLRTTWRTCTHRTPRLAIIGLMKEVFDHIHHVGQLVQTVETEVTTVQSLMHEAPSRS